MKLFLKKAAVTGGSSAVGLALIQKLLSEGVEALLLQRRESERRKLLPAHRLLNVELCSLEELDAYVPAAGGYDAFFHLGWADSGKDRRDDLDAQLKNVGYSCNAVRLAHRLGCKVFVGAGSQAEYGRKDAPMGPDTLCVPENAYGTAKLCAGHATKLMCREYGMRHNWARILSGYGLHDNMRSVLNSTILKSMRGERPTFSEGNQIWDFTYMDDIADALFSIAERGADGVSYPIGSGDARPLKEYLTVLCKKLGNLEDAEFGNRAYDKSQTMHLEADIRRLQEDTGWNPKVKFEDGIERVIAFHKKQLGRA